MSTTKEFFEVLDRVLLRCWLFGFVLLFIWTGAIVFGGEAIYRLHGPMFDLSKHELHVIVYCWIGSLKILLLTFFLFPWLALRMVLRNG